jgi:hypothetical protein
VLGHALEEIFEIEEIEATLRGKLLEAAGKLGVAGGAGHPREHPLPEPLRGDVGQALEVEVDEAILLGRHAERGGDVRVGDVAEQGCLSHAALADERGALVGAGEQAAGDLADLRLAAVGAGRGSGCRGEGIGRHVIRPQEW